MRYLYYCTTPFHILMALNMHFNNVIYPRTADDRATIVIVKFNNADAITERIKHQHIFDEVYLIEEEDTRRWHNKYKKFFTIMYDVFFSKRLLKQQFKSESVDFLVNRFDVIVASHLSHGVANIRTFNRNAEFYLMEDGLASYFGDFSKRLRSTGYLRLLKVRNMGRDVTVPKALYVMQKDICQNSIDAPIIQMPTFSENFLIIAFRIFGMPDKLPSYREKIIWLTSVTNTKEKESSTRKIADILSSYRKNDVIVRLHPRENNIIFYKSFNLDNNNNMWELLLSQISISDKLLITVGSTAVFSAKFLYDAEPHILFCYKLFPLPYGAQVADLELLVEKLRRSYRRPENIYTPGTWTEFEQYVMRFLQLKDEERKDST